MDLDEKIAIMDSNVRRREQDREAAAALETAPREIKRQELHARYVAAQQQVRELRSEHERTLAALDARGDKFVLDMMLIGLKDAPKDFNRARGELDAMLGSGNLSNIDVAIRRLAALSVSNWAAAADVLGELRGECPNDYRPSVQAAIYSIENAVDKFNARCRNLGMESQVVNYYLLEDYSPQEPQKPKVIVRKDVPDDAA